MAEYAKDVLVTTEGLAEHLKDASVVVAEVEEDPDLYEGGHIVGAVKLHWRDDLQDPLERDLVDREAFERLMGRLGISNASTTREELLELYESKGITEGKQVTAYAASASAAPTRGSSSASCWATSRSTTTRARGRSGATSWTCRSSGASAGVARARIRRNRVDRHEPGGASPSSSSPLDGGGPARPSSSFSRVQQRLGGNSGEPLVVDGRKPERPLQFPKSIFRGEPRPWTWTP
jgi:hypothetical protein